MSNNLTLETVQRLLKSVQTRFRTTPPMRCLWKSKPVAVAGKEKVPANRLYPVRYADKHCLQGKTRFERDRLWDMPLFSETHTGTAVKIDMDCYASNTWRFRVAWALSRSFVLGRTNESVCTVTSQLFGN